MNIVFSECKTTSTYWASSSACANWCSSIDLQWSDSNFPEQTVWAAAQLQWLWLLRYKPLITPGREHGAGCCGKAWRPQTHPPFQKATCAPQRVAWCCVRTQAQVYGCIMVGLLCEPVFTHMFLLYWFPFSEGQCSLCLSCNKDSKTKGAAERSPLSSQLTRLRENAFCII